MSLVITDTIVDGHTTDILVEDDMIERVQPLDDETVERADEIIDGSDTVTVPSLRNGHTHAGMTLFRGYADDLPLQEWLEEKIWPLEDQLTEEHVYWGTRLACEEMIQTGTTFFNDMYWHFDGIVDAVEDSGIRGLVSGVFIDQFDDELAQRQREANRALYERIDRLPDRVQFALGPHSIYTVSRNSLEWIGQFSRDHDLPVHIHLSETQKEVEDCRQQHGSTPVQYLDELDFLHEEVIVAHAIWLERKDIEILADRGVSVVYNPLSNLKLTAGDDFPYAKLTEAGVPVCLGTDGVASNNNLNLWEEIKTSALLQKSRNDDPTMLPAKEAFGAATRVPAEVFDAESAAVESGTRADFQLIDIGGPSMALADIHDPQSHFTYTMTPDAVDTVVCDGEVLLKNGRLTTKTESQRKVRDLARELCYQ